VSQARITAFCTTLPRTRLTCPCWASYSLIRKVDILLDMELGELGSPLSLYPV